METQESTALEQSLVIALVGNPNAGKTSIFNNLTGSRQHVGNWPGVTVEIKEGGLIHRGRRARVVDLPGTYSLGAYSEDELIARNFIVYDQPDLVINVVDAANLERNLFLTLQLLELGQPLMIALNMFDEAEGKGIKIDLNGLSRQLGVPVVPTVGTRGHGCLELMEAALANPLQPRPEQEPFKVDYGVEMEKVLAGLERRLAGEGAGALPGNRRWLAVKVLEEDENVLRALQCSPGGAELLGAVEEARFQLAETLNGDLVMWIAERRYRRIHQVVEQCVSRGTARSHYADLSDRIDAITTHRILGLPLFFLAMWAVFQFTFTLSEPLVALIETVFSRLGEATVNFLGSAGAPAVLSSLVSGGIIAGVGSVLTFIPNIFLLFLAISVLEDSGYMARAAFIMDRLMRGLGLHGRSFIPLLLGFGCNVPAIMAARTLESKKDRLLTILINPLMSCSARLPVYVLFVGVFFHARQGLVIFSLYLLGIVLAVAMGRLFKVLLFRGESAPFVMELPPYRFPTLKGLFIHMWERGSGFLRRAATIMVAASIGIWALANLPWGVEFASIDSLLGRLGGFFAPLLVPTGFGSWEAAVSLIFGLVAKEVVVSTLAVVYSAADAGLADAIAAYWTPLSAYAFMVMTLIYIPCMATIATIRKETNSWGWTGFAVSYSLVLGWAMAVLFYQGGRFLGLG